MQPYDFLLVGIGALASLLLALLLHPVLEEPARRFLVRALGRRRLFKQKQTLAGTWHMRDWRDDVPDDRFETETDDARLYQVGKQVWGTFTSRNRTYELSGRVEPDSLFTGTWSEPFSGIAWRGAFQFQIHYKARTMSGLWIGISKNGEKINSGPWEWKRPDVELYPSGEPFGAKLEM